MIDQKTVTALAVTTISFPELASNIIFQNNGTVSLRYALGGSVPTVSTGPKLEAGDTLRFSGHPSYRLRGQISFIAESTTATLDITADAS